jgi:hypothetical protein
MFLLGFKGSMREMVRRISTRQGRWLSLRAPRSGNVAVVLVFLVMSDFRGGTIPQTGRSGKQRIASLPRPGVRPNPETQQKNHKSADMSVLGNWATSP